MACKLKKKNTWGPQFPIVRLIFQRFCDDNLCLVLVFSVIYLDSWGIYRVRTPVRVFKKVTFSLFFSSFSFLFSFLHFLFYLFFLSGAPLAPGPLDIVHPCHLVATPLNVGPWSHTNIIKSSNSLFVSFQLSKSCKRPVYIVVTTACPNKNLTIFTRKI